MTDAKSKRVEQWTPLMSAAANNDVSAAESLLLAGVDFKCQDVFGDTAVTIAALAGSTKILKLLADEGADLTHRNQKGQSAYDLSVKAEQTEMTVWIVGRLFNQTPEEIEMAECLGRLAEKAKLEKLQQQVTHLMCNLRDRRIRTPLMWAAAGAWQPTDQHLQCLELLLLVGAKVELRDCNGWSAMDLAAAADNWRGIVRLAEAAVKQNLPLPDILDGLNDSGCNPLTMAAVRRHETAVRTLLQLGCQPNLTQECQDHKIKELICSWKSEKLEPYEQNEVFSEKISVQKNSRVQQQILVLKNDRQIVRQTFLEISNWQAEQDRFRKLESVNHINIIRYFSCTWWEDARSLTVDAEFVNSKTLSSLIREEFLTEKSVREFCQQIAAALAFLHLRGILHKNLSATSITVTQDGIVKVKDFEVSLMQECERDTVSDSDFFFSNFESLHCASPETLCRSESHSEKSDIWSFGCVLHYMVTQVLPNCAENLHKLREKLSGEEPKLPSHFSPDLRHLHCGCVQKKAENRMSAFDILTHPFLTSSSDPDAEDAEDSSSDWEPLSDDTGSCTSDDATGDKLEGAVDDIHGFPVVFEEVSSNSCYLTFEELQRHLKSASLDRGFSDDEEALVCRVAGKNLRPIGSFAEGWRIGDWQSRECRWLLLQEAEHFHLPGLGACDCESQKLQVVNGLVTTPTRASPATCYSTPACSSRPAVSVAPAFRCCLSCSQTDRTRILLGREATQPAVLLNESGDPTSSRLSISFCLQEVEIMKSLSEVQRQLFVILHLVLSHLLPDTQPFTSEHSKNLLFFIIERHGRRGDTWTTRSLISLLKECMDLLLEFLRESERPDECMPNFFLAKVKMKFAEPGAKKAVTEQLMQLSRDSVPEVPRSPFVSQKIWDKLDRLLLEAAPCEADGSLGVKLWTLLPLTGFAEDCKQDSSHSIYSGVRESINRMNGESSKLKTDDVSSHTDSVQLLYTSACFSVMESLRVSDDESAVQVLKKEMETLKKFPEHSEQKHLRDSDFCFELESTWKVDFLPPIAASVFPLRLPLLGNAYNCNFRILFFALCLDLLPDSECLLLEKFFDRNFLMDETGQELQSLTRLRAALAAKVEKMRRHMTPALYDRVADHLAPEKPSDISFTELQEEQSKYVLAERCSFQGLRRESGESIQAFAEKLLRGAEKCDFEEKDIRLRDQFICGLNSPPIIEKLVVKDHHHLSFRDAVSEAKANSSLMDSEIMKSAPKSESADVLKAKAKPQAWRTSTDRQSGSDQAQSQKNACNRCGRSHPNSACPAKGKKCFKCKKKNHFAKVCRSPAKSTLQSNLSHGKQKQLVYRSEAQNTERSTRRRHPRQSSLYSGRRSETFSKPISKKEASHGELSGKRC